MTVYLCVIIVEDVHLIGKFLFEAIFINSQSEIYFTVWAFAYCLLQASSDWRWLAVDGVSAISDHVAQENHTIEWKKSKMLSKTNNTFTR